MVSVLLIGIGGYGENYVKEFLLKEIKDAVLVGVADPFASQSPYKTALEEKGIPIYSNPEEAYAKSKVDLTVISSPIHTHYCYVMSALDSGSNVLVEKPVVIDLDKLKELERRESETSLFVAVGYQLCYSRDVLALKEDIASGLFGKPIRMKSIRMMRRTDSYYRRNSWAGKLYSHDERVFDSPLSNACAHQVENMLFLLDSPEVTEVEGVLYKARRDIENFDAAAIRVNTALGVPLYYYTAHCLEEKKVGPESLFEFEKAAIEEKDGNFRAVFHSGSVREYAMDKGARLQKLYDAIECCKTGARPTCSLADTEGHIKVVLETEKLPLYLRYDAKEEQSEDGDGYYAVPCLAAQYRRLYENWSLPEEARLALNK